MTEQKSKPKRLDLMKTIGMNIKREREARNITRKDLAEHIGIHPVTISKYEFGKISISIENLSKISNYLNVPVETLVKQEK